MVLNVVWTISMTFHVCLYLMLAPFFWVYYLYHHVKEVLLRLGGGEGEKKGVCVRERVFEATLRGGVGGESAEMKGGNGMVKRQGGTLGVNGFQKLEERRLVESFFDGSIVVSAVWGCWIVEVGGASARSRKL